MLAWKYTSMLLPAMKMPGIQYCARGAMDVSVRALSAASVSGWAFAVRTSFCIRLMMQSCLVAPLQSYKDVVFQSGLGRGNACLCQKGACLYMTRMHRKRIACDCSISCAGGLAPVLSNGAALGAKASAMQTCLFSSSAGFQEQSELTSGQLMHAAKMARLSGFTYRPVDDLTEWLSKEGLQLVARGQTHFTRSDLRDCWAASKQFALSTRTMLCIGSRCPLYHRAFFTVKKALSERMHASYLCEQETQCGNCTVGLESFSRQKDTHVHCRRSS